MKLKGCLHGCDASAGAPVDGGETPWDAPVETPRDPPMDGGEIPGGSPSGDFVLEDLPPRVLGPSPELGRHGDAEAVESTLRRKGTPFGELSAHLAAGTVGWMFLTALERGTEERDVLLPEAAERERELQDVIRKERKSLKTEIALLRNVLMHRKGQKGHSGCKMPWGR